MEGLVKQFQNCIEDVWKRSEKSVLGIYSFPQVWPNTSCGFGGVSGMAITTAQTFVFITENDNVFVYHNGRFAYEIKNPRMKIIYDCIQRSRFPGKLDFEKGNLIKEFFIEGAL